MNKILELIKDEQDRQESEICLIASENYVSIDVLKATGSTLINRYAEGYPNRRYYGGCEVVDKIEQYTINSCKKLFQCNYANVQPHSGSQANQAVYLALCTQPHHSILGMELNAGGHLTHGSKISTSGITYKSHSYGLDENGYLDYADLEEKLYEHQPRVLVVGASAYSRIIDFSLVRKMVDEYNFLSQKTKAEDGTSLEIPYCYLMVDMAHIAGLVAAGLHPSPIPYADIVTSTTHKTLRGARGGIILTNNEDLAKKIDKAVFPGNQGGPLLNMIAGKAICFQEAMKPEFKVYCEQILKNIKAMEQEFNNQGIDMVSGGSDNHLILLDLRKHNISGKKLEQILGQFGIVVNKNAVKNDPRPKSETSGIRIGTAAITTRGADEEDCRLIAQMICDVIYMLEGSETFSVEETLQYRNSVTQWCRQHPVYPVE